MMLERVCSVTDLADGEVRRFELGDLAVAVVRIGTDWYAIEDRCSHQDVALSDGEVLADSCEIECPKHGSCFSLRTGEVDTLPATRPVAAFGVRIDGGDVYVEVD
ncbi:MAG: non-heme iron oxygenase ferredoxin subunit [Acidimicrobiia bacterium]|nr:non-heme iron oxygenase ferredoxin subunit [Acidimicrobiia bacterium]